MSPQHYHHMTRLPQHNFTMTWSPEFTTQWHDHSDTATTWHDHILTPCQFFPHLNCFRTHICFYFNALRPAAGAGVQRTHSSLQSHHLALHCDQCILDSNLACLNGVGPSCEWLLMDMDKIMHIYIYIQIYIYIYCINRYCVVNMGALFYACMWCNTCLHCKSFRVKRC